MEEKKILEAALFISSKALTLEEIAKLLGIGSFGHVKKIIDSLKQDYEQRDSAIYLAEEGGAYILRLKPEYHKIAAKYAKETEISKHSLKTLAYISKKNGILKSKLCKALGSSIYKDVKELVENGFIVQKKKGRTSALFTTKKFEDYFQAKQ